MRTRDGYSDSLVLSEGRYESRVRRQERGRSDIEVEENHKSRILRINDLVVKRIAALKPVGEEV